MHYDYEMMHAAIKILDRRSNQMDDELCHKYGVIGRYQDQNHPSKIGPAVDPRLANEMRNYYLKCIDDGINKIDDNNPEIAKILMKHKNGTYNAQSRAEDDLIRTYANKIKKAADDKLENKYGDYSSTFFRYETQGATDNRITNRFNFNVVYDYIIPKIKEHFDIR